MKTIFTKFLICSFSLIFKQIFSQQRVSGKITDNHQISIGFVLVFNVSKNLKSTSDVSGSFTIEAAENDELRFVKENFYRTDRIIKKENLNSRMNVILLRIETLIPEVSIKYKPTGNLEKDIKYYSDSRKVASLKSSMEDYMKTPMSEPVPINEIPKTFQGHDFQAGHVNLLNVFGEAVRLIKKSSKPKITAPTYVETQSFLAKIKTELDLSFLTRYGMNEEGIDHFLLYAERVNHLSKRFRKDFKPDEIEYELKTAFIEYAKLNKLSQ
ncbi:hypothetical protein NZ698_17975 [Chryseobacterium sp. PBS4-4]|uniref:Carboxypeptidase-like regulatory domain-containing protein n=1 Tax=Chryseobacterium edaphi TaxID=2976532 RepID=A0ABT2WEP0_9FLAO|nr:hypothetical protein [Chryseobacterium edaphi]MCU7619070.1 hypothetical protein [Chryseobacterium edaphi]